MKTILKSTLVVLALLVGGVSFAQEPGTHDVKVQKFEELVKGGKGIILDVRTAKEFAEGHLDGAVNIDYFDPAFNEKVAKLDKTKPVYVYCHSGGRSAKAMKIMNGAGFKSIYNLVGGYNAWKSVHK